MKLGLDGIIDDIVEKSKHSTTGDFDWSGISKRDDLTSVELSKVISFIENNGKAPFEISTKNETPILGITGTGGAGKSSLIDELLLRFNRAANGSRVALISVDPTKRRTQGALLGDRIRLGAASFDQFYIRSLATRDSKNELSPQINEVINFLKSQRFDLIVVETSGIGEASDEIIHVADKTIYVMTPEYGASSQLEKIEMLGSADFVVLNKFEKPRSEDALRDIKKQFRREKGMANSKFAHISDEELNVFGTIASRFNDPGVNALFSAICESISFKNIDMDSIGEVNKAPEKKGSIISPDRALYLREISQAVRTYNDETLKNVDNIKKYESLEVASKLVDVEEISEKASELKNEIGSDAFDAIEVFQKTTNEYGDGKINYSVRGKTLSVPSKFKSLSGSDVSKVAFPKFESLADTYKFTRKSNLPGHFPYASGIFPSKRTDEDPKRMFAGEGRPFKNK